MPKSRGKRTAGLAAVAAVSGSLLHAVTPSPAEAALSGCYWGSSSIRYSNVASGSYDGGDYQNVVNDALWHIDYLTDVNFVSDTSSGPYWLFADWGDPNYAGTANAGCTVSTWGWSKLHTNIVGSGWSYYDVFALSLHEIGHVVGLAHPNNKWGCLGVMTDPLCFFTSLQTYDVNDINSLY